MACGNNGCNGNIVTNKLLDSNGLTYLKNLFNGKLFSIWGSLTTKGEKPINVEQSIGTAGETIVTVSADEAGKDEEGNYQSGIMSATDKEKLDGISVSGVTEGNGLTVDSEGNISMGEATETEAGAMSAEDKEKLDSLEKIAVAEGNGLSVDADGNISMGLASESEAGAMSSEDKLLLNKLAADVEIKVSNRHVLFTGNTLTEVVEISAWKCGEQVAIDSFMPIAMWTDVTISGSLSDGVLAIRLTRPAGMNGTSLSFDVQFTVGDDTYTETIYVQCADPCYDVLKGQVYIEDDKMIGTLWTFNGDKPTLRFVKDGTYWVNLPQSWADVLGEFDETRLFVQVTMAGKDAAAHVYCGRYDAGEDYNGNTASMDCWGAILVLVSDVENVAVDGSFYINVAYMPSVETYEAEKEVAEYDAPVVELGYAEVPHGGGTSEPQLSYSQTWRINGVEQTPITSGAEVKYELVENLASSLYTVSVDETTGVITATPTLYDHAAEIDLCTVKATVTLNGVSGEETATVRVKGSDVQ